MGTELVVISTRGPLGIAAVRLSAHAMERHGGVNYFAVDVTPTDGSAPWRVMRRYRDFDLLAQGFEWGVLRAPLPPKHFFGCEGAKLEARRQGLEAWLQQAVQACSDTEVGHLRRFLTVGRAALPALAAVPPSVAPPAPSAPPMLPATAPPAPTDEMELLQVQIPLGVGAGQALAVAVPDGRQILITVPEGALSDEKQPSIVELWYDAAAGTLAVAR